MQSQQICQILKEIIPELQVKIKEELRIQYDHKISQIQQYYHEEMAKLADKYNQVKTEYQSKSNANVINDREKQELYRRISMLEAQRKNWCQLEAQYQITIELLTKQLSMRSENKLDSSLQSNYVSTDFNLANPPAFSVQSQQISKWSRNKQRNLEEVRNSLNKEKQQKKDIRNYLGIQQNYKKQSIEEKNSLSKYIKQAESENDGSNKEHYHSVLSPPKDQQTMRSKKIFWDEGKKKQLLSLIKLN